MVQARKEALPEGDPNTALAQKVLAKTLLQSKVAGHAGQALMHILQSAEVLRQTAEKMHAECTSGDSWWSWLQATSANPGVCMHACMITSSGQSASENGVFPKPEFFWVLGRSSSTR